VVLKHACGASAQVTERHTLSRVNNNAHEWSSYQASFLLSGCASLLFGTLKQQLMLQQDRLSTAAAVASSMSSNVAS
jgi:hypothetical protein